LLPGCREQDKEEQQQHRKLPKLRKNLQ
jgi:hypothetical protein